MIGFSPARDWLNHFDRSHIDPASHGYLVEAFDPAVPLVDRVLALNRVIYSAATSIDMWEHPEALVIKAGFAYQHHNFADAHAALVSAYHIYQALPGSEHRLGVVLWLLGTIEWELNQNRIACDHWRAAREEYHRLGELYAAQEDWVRADWYNKCALAMSVDLACTPEEGYIWNKGVHTMENSGPGVAQRTLQAQLQTAVLAGDVLQVNAIVTSLLRLARNNRNNLDKGTAYLECGLAEYHIGDLVNAYGCINKAIRSYFPDHLHQAMAQWILGGMQWKVGLAEQAIKNWSHCREAINVLRERANWDKDLVRLNWYLEKMELMELAFDQMVQA
jgi:tetratricopeptide (TPR) repeat protein